jgi:cellulose biosynthesis protein BcsQ
VVVISVCSLKGGVGKTSVVLGLASAALERGVPTLVVDLDPQADATLALDIADEPTDNVAYVLGASRRNVAPMKLAPSGWAPDGGALDVLPGSPDVAALDRPSGSERTLARLSQAITSTRGYRLVLIDCPPSLGTITRSGMGASHRAVVVTEPALFSVTAADRALHAVQEVRRTSCDPGAQRAAAGAGRQPADPPLARGTGSRGGRGLRRAPGPDSPGELPGPGQANRLTGRTAS